MVLGAGENNKIPGLSYTGNSNLIPYTSSPAPCQVTQIKDKSHDKINDKW